MSPGDGRRGAERERGAVRVREVVVGDERRGERKDARQSERAVEQERLEGVLGHSEDPALLPVGVTIAYGYQGWVLGMTKDPLETFLLYGAFGLAGILAFPATLVADHYLAHPDGTAFAFGTPSAIARRHPSIQASSRAAQPIVPVGPSGTPDEDLSVRPLVPPPGLRQHHDAHLRGRDGARRHRRAVVPGRHAAGAPGQRPVGTVKENTDRLPRTGRGPPPSGAPRPSQDAVHRRDGILERPRRERSEPWTRPTFGTV